MQDIADLINIDIYIIFFCRIFQSDLHSSRCSGERDEVSSCHEPPKGHRPRAWHSMDWSLCGQCCKYVTALYFLVWNGIMTLLVLIPNIHVYIIEAAFLYVQCSNNMLSTEDGQNNKNLSCIMQHNTLYCIGEVLIACITSYFAHVLLSIPVLCSNTHMCVSAFSSLFSFMLLEWLLIISFINLHGSSPPQCTSASTKPMHNVKALTHWMIQSLRVSSFI